MAFLGLRFLRVVRHVSVPFTRGTPPWRWGRRISTTGYTVSVPFTRGTPPWLFPDEETARTYLEFQSPSRGGHLRGVRTIGPDPQGAGVSVPFTRGTPPWRNASGEDRAEHLLFQSPSRGGHLRGMLCPNVYYLLGVSVPFTRGTPPWPERAGLEDGISASFSPLHEGDTSVARNARCMWLGTYRVSVPFTRGTPPWPRAVIGPSVNVTPFQSPSRGGHLRGAIDPVPAPPITTSFSPLHEGDTSVAPAPAAPGLQGCQVSVPFTRGTPPWRFAGPYLFRSDIAFQSPSRGGHLRGATAPH